MGFFSKLFEKKICDLCGGEIGLLGNRKLEDGNMCKECAGKLSPWFDERRNSTVDQIRQQLQYREENQQQLATFRPVKSFGDYYTLKAELVDGVPTRFVVCRREDHVEENADLISFRDVTGFRIDIDENEEEQKYRNDQGEEVSYRPPRYTYSYDFYGEISTTNPYCDEIRFRINDTTLELETVMGQSRGPTLGLLRNRSFEPELYPEYRRYKALCQELEELFQAGMQGISADPEAQNQPEPEPEPEPQPAPVASGPKFCGSCGAPADGGKFCQHCGSPL